MQSLPWRSEKRTSVLGGIELRRRRQLLDQLQLGLVGLSVDKYHSQLVTLFLSMLLDIDRTRSDCRCRCR